MTTVAEEIDVGRRYAVHAPFGSGHVSRGSVAEPGAESYITSMPKNRQKPLLLAIIGLGMAVASMYSVVPRIRAVEAAALFATAFGTGAALAAALTPARRDDDERPT